MIEQETNFKLEHEKFQRDNREKSPHEDGQTLEQRPIQVEESLSLEILLGTWQGNLPEDWPCSEDYTTSKGPFQFM